MRSPWMPIRKIYRNASPSHFLFGDDKFCSPAVHERKNTQSSHSLPGCLCVAVKRKLAADLQAFCLCLITYSTVSASWKFCDCLGDMFISKVGPIISGIDGNKQPEKQPEKHGGLQSPMAIPTGGKSSRTPPIAHRWTQVLGLFASSRPVSRCPSPTCS